MKASGSLLLALLSVSASAHYVFNHLVVDGVETGPWQYVRDVAAEANTGYNDNEMIGKVRPQEDINSEAMACGRQAFRTTQSTQTVDLQPGTALGFNIQHDFDSQGNGFDNIFHNGPAQIYLARAPNDDLSTFNGTEGKWFKIASITAAHDTRPNADYWITYGKNRVNFTLPEATPPGKYLLRIEHFMAPQFYVNCAHVNVLGNGAGVITDSDYATFPGSYKLEDPGSYPYLSIIWSHRCFPVSSGFFFLTETIAITLDYKIWNKPGALLNYVGPGPKVWDGSGSSKREVEFIA
ncbi:unnamed protein product [Periconia digitata]|uniref:lytic cellulose monooxygenase (C4-dehydrogenating) n=1 Tax=Periconia digitata TaxID=1303443 RepID=A0A9W4U2R6_9PLEO|nr:unnamed protein product [Periconia digitata]